MLFRYLKIRDSRFRPHCFFAHGISNYLVRIFSVNLTRIYKANTRLESSGNGLNGSLGLQIWLVPGNSLYKNNNNTLTFFSFVSTNVLQIYKYLENYR